MKSAIGQLRKRCECDLRHRAWNPNTERCETCGVCFDDGSLREAVLCDVIERDRRATPARPQASDRRPTWEIVIAYVEQLQRDSTYISLGVGESVLPLVIVDMHARDAVGLQRYGIPLTSGDGRDHLIEAYEEMLDASVYLTNELHGHGVELTTQITEEAFPDRDQRWYLHDVQQLCTTQIRALIHLRAIVEERKRRATAAEGPTP